MPNVQVRGVNSLPTTDVTNLNAEYKGNSNLPTFILDGFEVSVEKIYDLDPNRVSNISILKDASATAIYGSRASNGVVIIDTKAPESGRLRLNYTGSIDLNLSLYVEESMHCCHSGIAAVFTGFCSGCPLSGHSLSRSLAEGKGRRKGYLR